MTFPRRTTATVNHGRRCLGHGCLENFTTQKIARKLQFDLHDVRHDLNNVAGRAGVPNQKKQKTGTKIAQEI